LAAFKISGLQPILDRLHKLIKRRIKSLESKITKYNFENIAQDCLKFNSFEEMINSLNQILCEKIMTE